MPKTSPVRFIVTCALSSLALLSFGCGSNNTTSGPTSPSGEVVSGPLDSHCALPDGGQTIQTIGVCDVIDPARVPTQRTTCDVTFDEDAGTGASTAVDASTDADAAAPTSDYGATMYGSAGDDDDCKYYVSWISTPIVEKADTYFTVTAIRLQDGKPATCAGIIPDVKLNITTGAPSPANPPTEIMPGVYKVGPIRFSQAGIWTVRFHLYEECDDTPHDSPHGHAAFFVNVP
jgi:hypothetical protein